jgi:DNA-binding Xre family transcriptional regulator
MKGLIKMISYEPLWKTMKTKNISQYELINKYKFSAGQLSRLRKNSNVSTHTLNVLCEILDCSLSDIAIYKKEQN